MPPLAAAVLALIGLVVIFSAVWAWQLKTANAGMVDPVWAYSLGLVAVLYAALGTGDPLTRALTALAGLAWGARLGTHLWKRNYGRPEDARYPRAQIVALSNSHGQRAFIEARAAESGLHNLSVVTVFGYANGNEWGVGHYRFVKRQTES
jgi:steroid 5-alpha reductase family enzyme